MARGGQLRLNITVEDKESAENFRRIQDFFRDFPLLKGAFKFFEFTYTNTTGSAIVYTDLVLVHNLGFTPSDVLQTSLVGGPWTWNYSKFTAMDLVATITVPANSFTTVRAFIGRYSEEDING